MKPINVLFAGGGTGGHLTPGLAVAAELQRRCPEVGILFVGTPKPLERGMVERAGFSFAAVESRPLGRSPLAMPAYALSVISALRQARRLTGSFRPDVVVGLGGYGCVGPVLSAILRGRPLILLEQNVVPGKATRLFARWSDEVCCQFAETLPRLKSAPAVCTGNPIRAGIGDCSRQDGLARLGLSPLRRTLLVMGGSQGALALNEAMIAAIPALADRRESLQVIHLAGKERIDEVRRVYDEHRVVARVEEFLQDMPAAYAAADLALSRAGATSLAEMAAAGVPALLVPYPHAADDHQSYNAAAYVARGAAAVIRQPELTAERLVRTCSSLLWNDARLDAMRKSARSLGAPHAAATVVDHLLSIARNRAEYAMARTAAL